MSPIPQVNENTTETRPDWSKFTRSQQQEHEELLDALKSDAAGIVGWTTGRWVTIHGLLPSTAASNRFTISATRMSATGDYLVELRRMKPVEGRIVTLRYLSEPSMSRIVLDLKAGKDGLQPDADRQEDTASPPALSAREVATRARCLFQRTYPDGYSLYGITTSFSAIIIAMSVHDAFAQYDPQPTLEALIHIAREIVMPTHADRITSEEITCCIVLNDNNHDPALLAQVFYEWSCEFGFHQRLGVYIEDEQCPRIYPMQGDNHLSNQHRDNMLWIYLHKRTSTQTADDESEPEIWRYSVILPHGFEGILPTLPPLPSHFW
jgi:hypothetical protein